MRRARTIIRNVFPKEKIKNKQSVFFYILLLVKPAGDAVCTQLVRIDLCADDRFE